MPSHLLTLIVALFSFNLHAFDESKFAASLGLDQVSQGHPLNYLGINNIYANDTLGRQMLVVSEAPGTLKNTRIIKQKDFLILEIPKSNHTYVSMALVGIAEEEIKGLIKTSSVWKTILRELNPIQAAYAEDCALTGLPDDNSLFQLQNLFGSSVGKGAAKCISSFFQGIWDSTGGTVADVAKGFKNLFADPAGFWEKKVEGFKNIVSFIQNFETQMKLLVQNISSLPSETKTMLICNFVGGIGTGIALGIISGGAGLALALVKVQMFVSKLGRLSHALMALNLAGKLQSAPPQFFKRLASDEIPDKVIEDISTFAKHDLPDVIQGAMLCVL